jgi:predicted nucleotidyltransferase
MRKKKEKYHSNSYMAPVEETLQAYFKNRSEVVLVYLFGSFVKSTTGRFHDIDIAVLVTPGLEKELDQEMAYGYGACLNAEVAHVLKYGSIDLILLNHAPPLLLRQVISTGKLIFCQSEMARIRFEVASLKRYSDTQHIRRIKRLYMKQRIEKGLLAYG